MRVSGKEITNHVVLNTNYLRTTNNLVGRHSYPPTLFTQHAILVEDTLTCLLSSNDTQSWWKTQLSTYSLQMTRNLGRHPYPPTFITRQAILLEDTLAHLLSSHDTQSCGKTPLPTYCLHKTLLQDTLTHLHMTHNLGGRHNYPPTLFT